MSKFEIAKILHKCVWKCLPSNFDGYFKEAVNTHNEYSAGILLFKHNKLHSLSNNLEWKFEILILMKQTRDLILQNLKKNIKNYSKHHSVVNYINSIFTLQCSDFHSTLSLVFCCSILLCHCLSVKLNCLLCFVNPKLNSCIYQTWLTVIRITIMP